MPGPLSQPGQGRPIRDRDGELIGYTSPTRATHEKCQDRRNCTGPGCRVRSGKTERKNNR